MEGMDTDETCPEGVATASAGASARQTDVRPRPLACERGQAGSL